MIRKAVRYLFWSAVALFWGCTMRAGVRYGGKSFRWAVLRAAVLERDGQKCQKCGSVAAYNGTWLEVHHKRHVAKGGGYGPLNLTTLCQKCHKLQH